jgi:hypothetical protein
LHRPRLGGDAHQARQPAPGLRARLHDAEPVGQFGASEVAVLVTFAYRVQAICVVESIVYLTTGMVDRGAKDFSMESSSCKAYGTEML